MSTRRVLISGASIAGPALAWWLARYGWSVTVVERFDGPREGGQNIDVRGAAREVLRRMELEDEVLSAGTGEQGIAFVDDRGRRLAESPAGSGDTDGATAELELLRGDLVLPGAEVSDLGLHVAYLTIPRTPADDDWWRAYTGTRSRVAWLRPDNHGTGLRAQRTAIRIAGLPVTKKIGSPAMRAVTPPADEFELPPAA